MKIRLTHQITILLALGVFTFICGTARAADTKPKPKASNETSPSFDAIDPATGLPITSWKDPAWVDPDETLPEVNYDGLPAEDVARQLRKEFKDAFDVLIPNTWQDPNDPNRTIDPRSTSVRLQLKNVTASEIFNAMNLMFELENTPCRWELKMNGTRPTAVLRVLPHLLPATVPQQVVPTRRTVLFVGDLLDIGVTMEQLVKTVSEVYKMSYGDPKGVLQFHKDAQLLVITGTPDQIGFMQETLSALRGKFRAQHKSELKPVPPGPKAEEAKPK